jgi:DNA-binding response OmpR family regulator
MPSSTSSSTTHLVLVADDEPSMLELVSNHLKQHTNPRLDVLEASDGEEAWRIARERLPDLVVLDVMMPEMSGWEVCKRIREDVALAHTGVVMLTGIGENLNQMTSPLYGADAYLDKSLFDFDELDAKVKQALLARAALRGGIQRPQPNGVAGPAKVAPGAAKGRRPAKKAAPPTKAAPKKVLAVAKKVAKKAAKKPTLKVAPKKVAKKAAKSAVKGRVTLATKKTAKKAKLKPAKSKRR